MTDADDEWGDFAGDDNTAAPALYSKGSDILYQTRDGAWVPGKVISVDISIVPPSYCIEVQGNLRETEEWRLKPPSSAAEQLATTTTTTALAAQSLKEEIKFQNATLNQHPAPIDKFEFNVLEASLNGDMNNEEEDDFGDFSVATEAIEHLPPPLPLPSPPPPPPPLPAVPSFHSSPRNRTSTGSSTPKSPHTGGNSSNGGRAHSVTDGSIEGSFRKFLSMAAPNIAHVLEEEDALQTTKFNKLAEETVTERRVPVEEDAFGDFTDAPLTQGPLEELKIEVDSVPIQNVEESVAASHSLSPFFRNLGPVHSSIHTNTARSAMNAVQEYGVAWTLILTTAAEKLEQGRLFWITCGAPSPFSSSSSSSFLDKNKNNSIQLEILNIPRALEYFAALGRVYYIASLVRLAAEMQGLLHFVHELEVAWTRCFTAWRSSTDSTNISSHIHGTAAAAAGSSTGEVENHYINNATTTTMTNVESNSTKVLNPLNCVSIESAKKLGLEYIITEIESLEAVAAMVPTLSLDEFPRMLAWSEGLDSMLLLPLSVIAAESIAAGGEGRKNREEIKRERAVEWPEKSGRLCLTAVANFWLGCVSSVPPDLE